MRHRAFLSLFAIVLGCEGSALSRADAASFEVWLIDQSDSDHRAGVGGTLYVFSGVSLGNGDPAVALPLSIVDLADEAGELCSRVTGSKPTRPSSLKFMQGGSVAAVTFWQSGHVVLLSAADRTPLACVRVSAGTNGIRQAYSSALAPGENYLVITNPEGGRLERIVLEPDGHLLMDSVATLDLGSWSEDARENRGERRSFTPLCVIVDREFELAWVTLRDGGFLVVDPRTTPMSIVGEYSREVVSGNGCGLIQADANLIFGAGAAPGTYVLGGFDYPHDHHAEVYRIALSGQARVAPGSLPVPELIFEADGERDARGMALVPGTSYAWVVDRHADVIEIIDVAAFDRLATVNLNGVFTQRAAPEMIAFSPNGEFAFVTLRGPTPIFSDPHNAHGSTPGLAVVRVERGGRMGTLLGVRKFMNDFQGQEMADPSALGVRILN